LNVSFRWQWLVESVEDLVPIFILVRRVSLGRPWSTRVRNALVI
jgi:hypothetical protein